MPWWQQRLYVEGLIEEFGEADDGQPMPNRVWDLDEDGSDVLEQFGMARQVV